MRGIVTFVLTVGSGVLTGPALAAQGTPARPALAACSLLPKDVVAQVTPYDKRAFERVTMIPPNEEPAGKSGSACSYGGIHLQVDTRAPAEAAVTRDGRQTCGMLRTDVFPEDHRAP
jgi:hypothetical protein